MPKRHAKPALRARPGTPDHSSPNMRCDGLVLQVGVPGMLAPDALKVARRVVTKCLPGEWTYQAMGTESRDVLIRRVDRPNPTSTQGFEMARKLRRDREVEDCEPSLYMVGDPPAEMLREFDELQNTRSSRRSTAQTRSASASSSTSTDDGHESCSVTRNWALNQCQIPQAWELPRSAGGKARGDGILIGHPDTGYTRHPQLDRSRVLNRRGRDFEEGSRDPLDRLNGFSAGHGTSTGSVLMSGEDQQLTGVAPLSRLIPLRVTTSVVLFSFGKLAEAIRFAADQGHHVVSISLGGPLGARFLRRSVRYAIDRGVIIVAAAGNVWPWVVHPASLDDVIAAAASNCRRGEWSGSASGRAVDITAPGESIWRAQTDPGRFSVQRGSGTSFATAMTAGAAALWLAHHGREKLIRRFGTAQLAAVFKELLTSRGFTRPAGWDTTNFGPGILNVRKLLSADLPGSSPAGGMRGVRSPFGGRGRTHFEELAEVLPGSDSRSVELAMQQLLHAEGPELDEAMAEVVDEVAYHAVMDVPFRKSLMRNVSQQSGQDRSTGSRRRRTAGGRPRRGRLRKPAQMSRTLKKMMTR